jgi:hypothetical protein
MLAGAAAFGAGVLARAVLQAGKQFPEQGDLGVFGGIALVGVGFFLLLSGLWYESAQRARGPGP